MSKNIESTRKYRQQMKTLTLITALVLLIGFDVKAQSEAIKIKADSMWATRPIRFDVSEYSLPRNYTSDEYLLYEESQIKANINREMYCRLLREWGIEFWRQFPNDPRRIDWLMMTCNAGQPKYFANIREGAIAQIQNRYVVDLDTIAKNHWNKLINRYLKDLYSLNTFNEYTKLKIERIIRDQLTNGLFDKKWRNSEDEKFDYEEYISDVLLYNKKYGSNETISNMLGVLYRDREDFGLDDLDVTRYIGLLKATGVAEFHKAAIQMESLMKLQNMPFQFNAVANNGKQINLKQYKGMLVLIDFWSLGCTICIEKMPEIKDVYDSYKDKGFQVISVCLSGQISRDKEKILQTHQKIGADWPLTILNWQSGGMGREIFETYGWVGVPQLLLLDEEGKLIQYQGKMLTSKGSLEKLVEQHLVKKSLKN